MHNKVLLKKEKKNAENFAGTCSCEQTSAAQPFAYLRSFSLCSHMHQQMVLHFQNTLRSWQATTLGPLLTREISYRHGLIFISNWTQRLLTIFPLRLTVSNTDEALWKPGEANVRERVLKWNTLKMQSTFKWKYLQRHIYCSESQF